MPKRMRSAKGRSKTERAPRGPIRERSTGRLLSIDDDSDEGLDFDPFAPTPADSEESESEE
jgi:hypothetical protein